LLDCGKPIYWSYLILGAPPKEHNQEVINNGWH